MFVYLTYELLIQIQDDNVFVDNDMNTNYSVFSFILSHSNV